MRPRYQGCVASLLALRFVVPPLSGLRNCFLWLAAAVHVTAGLPQPQLTSVFPCGGRAGDKVEVKLAGTQLDGAGLRFTHPGITSAADAKDPKKQTITIAKDVPPGLYDVRVTGPTGVSNPRVFQVGGLAEALESPKHATRETAMEISAPCIVNGTAGSQEDDWYKISAVKGRRLFVRCLAAELDSKMVPALALYDGEGRELRRERHRGALDWLPEADGPLFIQLSDTIYKGGPEYFYRLELSDQPPAPLVEDTKLFWPLAAKTTDKAMPNDAAHSQSLTPPCEINADFAAEGRADCYSFQAKKGDVWWMEVTSQRLGQKTNPRLVITLKDKDVLELNDGPPVPGMPDFDGSHLDPVGKFEAKEDGDYRLTVRDLAHVAGGPPAHYQLSIRKAAPDFALVALPVPEKEDKAGKDFNGPVVSVCNHNMRRGETLPVRVIILRRDGFDGEIHLKAEGLPPGVSSCETVMAGDTQDTTVMLRAAADAPAFAGPVRIVGSSGSLRHEARGTTTLWNLLISDFIEPSHWRFTQETVLGVVPDETIPVVLKVDDKPLEAKAVEKVKIHVSATRTQDFKAPVKYRVAGIAGLEKTSELSLAPNINERDDEVDLAPLKLQPGLFTLWLAGSTQMKVKGKDVTVNLYSNPVTLNVQEAAKKSK